MELTVETGYLRGYAGQVDGNRGGALSAMRGYCATYCGDINGLGGLLTPARRSVDSTTQAFLRLLEGADRGLWLTAYDLRQTADNYDRSDGAAADRLWTSGRTWELPAGYREQDATVVSSGFTGGAAVNLVVPARRHDAQTAKAAVVAALGSVNRVVHAITGKDLLAQVMPIVFGEWGTLRRVAQAHDELGQGFGAVAADLTHGMDDLSAHWSGPPGGASTAFDYHMRRRWIRGFTALADASNAAQQTYEWMANAYEDIVNSLLLALNFYAQRIRKAVAGLAADSVVTAAWSLIQLVNTVVQLVADTVRLIELQTRMFASAVEMMVANLHSLFEMFRGDLDVFSQA